MFNSILSGVSEANRILLQNSEPKDAFDGVLKALGSATGVDRCYIFKNEIMDSDIRLHYIHEWCKEGIKSELDNPELKDGTYSLFPGLYETLSTDRPLFGLVKLSKHPLFREIMEMQGILAYAFTPIFCEDVFWGWIGFDDCTHERIWNKDEVESLHAVARNIGVLLEKKNAAELTKAAYQRFELTLEASQQGIWEWEPQTNKCFFSPQFMKMLGYDYLEFPHNYHEWHIRIHPEDVSRVEEKLKAYLEEKIGEYSNEFRIRQKDGTYRWIRGTGIAKRDASGKIIQMVGSHLDVEELKNRQLEVERQRNEFDRLLNNLSEVVVSLDLEGRIIFFNSMWEKITKYSFESCVSESFADFIYEPDRNIFTTNLNQLINELTEYFEIELRIVQKNEELRWIKLKLGRHIDFSEQPYFAGTIEDIHNQRSVEIRLDRILQAINDVIYSVDLLDNRLNILTANSESLFGIVPEDYSDLNHFISAFVHPDDQDLVKSLEEMVIDGKKDYHKVFRFYNRAKEKFVWVSDNITVVRDAKQNPVQIFGVMADIDEYVNSKLKYEEELKYSEERYRFLAENGKDLICQHSPDFKFTYVSSSSLEVLGYTPEEMIKIDPIDLIHPECYEVIKDSFLKQLESGKIDPITLRVKRKDGSYIWIEMLFKLLYDFNNSLSLIQTSSRDISERIQANLEMEAALKQEKELGELKSNFVSMASHQFRTPLTVIYSNIELLEMHSNISNADLKPKIEKVASRIKAEIDRLTELMNNILLFGKYEANKVKIVTLPVDIEQLINRFVTSHVFHGDSRVLRFEVQGNSHGRLVPIDELLFSHVLTNLVSNAYKYSRKSVESPIIQLLFHTYFIEIKIIDFGMGIPEAELGRLFDSFFRASNTATLEGTGLGMVVVKQFVELHGGTIFIESQLDIGTTATIKLRYND